MLESITKRSRAHPRGRRSACREAGTRTLSNTVRARYTGECLKKRLLLIRRFNFWRIEAEAQRGSYIYLERGQSGWIMLFEFSGALKCELRRARDHHAPKDVGPEKYKKYK